jgi:hypothetical protein
MCGVPLILPRVKHGAGLLQRTSKYASLLRISGALYLGIFDQPEKNEFFNGLLTFDIVSSISSACLLKAAFLASFSPSLCDTRVTPE